MIYVTLNNSPYYGGGVEQVVNNILKRFTKNEKMSVTLICNDNEQDGFFSFDGINCINLKTKNFPFVILDKLFLLTRLIYSYKIYKFFRANRVKDGLCVVNFHGLEYAFFSCVFRKRLKNTKIIITLHGTTLLEFSEYIQNLQNYWFLKMIYNIFLNHYYSFIDKTVIKNADTLISISKFLQKYVYENYKRDVDKVIYNGLDVHAVINDKIQKPTDSYNAVIVGSTVLRKGLDVLIQAVKAVNRSETKLVLNIVGFSDFNKFYKISELPDYIKYIGRIPPEHKQIHYLSNDLFFLASRHESFPLTILEALQFRLPILVSKFCKAEEIPNIDKVGYIVETLNIDEWVKFINKVIDPVIYNNFQKNISSIVLDEFDWNIISNKYRQQFFDQQ